MPDVQKSTELKGFLESLLPSGDIAEIADTQEAVPRMGASLDAAAEAPSGEMRAARTAVEKLAIGQDLDDHEAFLIEAIIIPDKRPAVDILDGGYTVGHRDWLHFNDNINIRNRIVAAIPAVGRIELPGHPFLPYGGTGFLVADDLVMTNRHVAEIFSSGLGSKGLAFLPGHAAGIDYRQERGSSESRFAAITRIRMIHPFWDMALLQIEEAPEGVEPLALSLREPEDLAGSEIAVIGYPAFDPRNDAAVQNRVFNGVYNVKRLQPGFLKERRRISSFGSIVDSVTHDASTLGGNSGSLVLDVATGDVVALHFAGRYKQANYAVPSYELSRDDRVVGTGIEFGEDALSNIEDPNPWSVHWDQADPDRNEQAPGDASATGAPADQAAPGNAAGTPASTLTSAPAGVSRWTIPITVDISIGGAQLVGTGTPQPATAAHAPDTAAVERMVEPLHDTDYSDRAGYDEDFMGLAAPMPMATDEDRLSRLDDGSHVLKYHHFSIILDKKRRMPLITAANVDTRPASLKPDPTRKYNRKALNGFTSDNDREKWFPDPRIPADHQLPDKFFNKDRKAFDKGHVVRRNAVVWGRTYREVQLANGDTFHSTNCTPQVKGFNRSREGGEWGELENHIFKQSKSEKLCVFAGPVLKADDRIFQGVDDDGAVQVRIPSAYWKVVAANADGTLEVFAFKLEQDLTDVAFEFALTQDWKARQIPLRELEDDLDGVRFDQALHDADQAGTDAGEAVRSMAGLG